MCSLGTQHKSLGYIQSSQCNSKPLGDNNKFRKRTPLWRKCWVTLYLLQNWGRKIALSLVLTLSFRKMLWKNWKEDRLQWTASVCFLDKYHCANDHRSWWDWWRFSVISLNVEAEITSGQQICQDREVLDCWKSRLYILQLNAKITYEFLFYLRANFIEPSTKKFLNFF
jgi:hypothetical protein